MVNHNEQSGIVADLNALSQKRLPPPDQGVLPAKTAAPVFIAGRRDIAAAIALALGYHLLLLLLFAGRNSVDLFEFWIFFACDVLLWTVLAVPLISVVRGSLPWYDSVALLSVVIFAVSATFSLAYLFDPTYVRPFTAYGSIELSYVSETQYLSLVAAAELLIAAFAVIMLLTNRRQVAILPLQPSSSRKQGGLADRNSLADNRVGRIYRLLGHGVPGQSIHFRHGCHCP